MTAEERSASIGTEKIPKLIISFCIPTIIGAISSALYNIVDRIFLGHANVDTTMIAGLTVALPITLIITALSALIGVGGATFYSIKLGEGKLDHAEKIMNTSYVVSAIVFIVYIIVGQIFLDKILMFCGGTEENLEYAMQYARVILGASFFHGLSLMCMYYIRSDGFPAMVMIVLIAGSVVNLVMDFILISVLTMGIQGAAIATGCGQLVSLLVALSYFFGKRCAFRLSLKKLRIYKGFLPTMLSMGLPTAFLQFVNAFMNSMFNNTIVLYGDQVDLAAGGIILTVNMLTTMVVIGISQAAQPIIGFNYGAKKMDRVKESMKFTLLLVLAVMLAIELIIELFTVQFAALFDSDMITVNRGIPYIREWFMLIPLLGVHTVITTGLQAMGFAKKALFLNMWRTLICFIPFIYLFGNWFQLDGMFFASPAADFMGAIVASIMLAMQYRKWKKEDAKASLQ